MKLYIAVVYHRMNLYGLGEQRIHQIKEGHEDRRKD